MRSVSLQAGRSRATDSSVGLFALILSHRVGSCLQVCELLKEGKPASQHPAGCKCDEDWKRTLRCCLVDVREADRASGYIQAFSARFADCCFALRVWRESVCPVSRRFQGAVHEPTSFQAPLLNRAGLPREGVGERAFLTELSGCGLDVRESVRCRSW